MSRDLPLRVGFVIDALRRGAGTENQLLLLCERLDRERVLPFVCCLRGDDETDSLRKICPVEVLDLEKLASLRGLSGLWACRRWARSNRLDLVVTFFRDANFVGTVSAGSAGVPVLSSRRNLGYWQTPFELKILRFLDRFTREFIANSEAARRHAAQAEGIDPARIAVLPNALDTETFRPAGGEERADSRAALGLSMDAFVTGCVANLRPVKNHALLLDAFAQARGRIGEAKLVLVGDGPEEQRLRILAHELGINADVLFLGQRSDVPRILRALDCGVLASTSESHSNALLECLATGIPVVASAVPGNVDLLQSGELGVLVPAGESVALSAALVELALNIGLRNTLASAGRVHVIQIHGIQAVVSSWQMHLESIVRE